MTNARLLEGVERPWGVPYWLDFERPEYPALEGDLVVDAVVIGAGIAGLRLARCLARDGLSVVVVEGAHVGAGASSRNQGSINHGPSFDYLDAIRRHGRDVARQLWRLGLENLALVRAELDEFAIACDFRTDGFTYLVRTDMPDVEAKLDAYREEARLLHEDSFDVDLLDERGAAAVSGWPPALCPPYAGGLRYNSDAQFHSGKLVYGLAAGITRDSRVRLFERTRVMSLRGEGNATAVVTSGGTVRAAVVLLATNALVPQYVPRLERALRAERGQVFVTEPLSERPCRGSFGTTMAWWRELPEPDGRFRLLFGGGRQRDEPDSLFPQFDETGKPHPLLEAGGFQPSDAHQKRLEIQFAALFPHLAAACVTHRWGGLQSFTADGLPLIGRFDEELNLWGMAGFCGRGNCHANVGAEFLSARLTGVGNRVARDYGPLFDGLMAVDRPGARWGEWRSLW